MRNIILATALFCICHTNIAQKLTMSGFISDKSTGMPLPGAVILLPTADQACTSGDDGHYYFKGMEPKVYSVSISFTGYQTQKLLWNLNADNTTLNIDLEEKPILISEIVVTGTGTEHYTKEAPVQTEVISGKAISSFAGRDIEEVLGSLSPSITFNRGDMGSNLQMNGLKNDYILILIDGKRLNGDIGGQIDLSRINMNNVERIEILKGAASSLYGSDAIGGVINFIMKKNQDKVSISNNTRIGHHADINQSNTIGISHKRWNSSTALAFKHTDGWQITQKEWYRNELYDNSVTKTVNTSTNYTVSQDLKYQASDKLTLNTGFSYYEKWTSRPIGAPQWRRNDLYYNDINAFIGAKHFLNQKSFISFDLSLDEFDYYYDYTSREYTNEFDSNDNRIIYYSGDRVLQTAQQQLLSSLKGVFYPSDKHVLSTGAEWLNIHLESPRKLENDEANNWSASLFMQDEWNISDQLNITMGLRAGRHKEFGSTLTPKISAMYKAGNYIFRAGYSNGFKAPSIKELYYRHHSSIMSKYKAYYGDTDLKPEKSDYYSIGAEYSSKRIKTSMTLYHNNIRNMISLQKTETSYEDKLLLVEETMRYVNLAHGRTYGGDLSMDALIGHGCSVSAGYSYLDAKGQQTENIDSPDYMKYVRINGTSIHNASFRVSWSGKGTIYKPGISLSGRYQSERFYISDGNTKAHQIWRLNTSHKINGWKQWIITAHVGVDNILNYTDNIPTGRNRSNTTPGRTLYFSLIMKYQNKTKQL